MENARLTSLFVIEDDDVDFKLLTRSLNKRKIANPVVRAIDGVDALEKIKNKQVQKPFIVLLDLNMPRMNGSEFLQALRQDREHESSVVFILTTSNDEKDIADSFKHHVAGYFLKDNASSSIDKIVDVIDGYWQIVQLPR